MQRVAKKLHSIGCFGSYSQWL